MPPCITDILEIGRLCSERRPAPPFLLSTRRADSPVARRGRICRSEEGVESVRVLEDLVRGLEWIRGHGTRRPGRRVEDQLLWVHHGRRELNAFPPRVLEADHGIAAPSRYGCLVPHHQAHRLEQRLLVQGRLAFGPISRILTELPSPVPEATREYIWWHRFFRTCCNSPRGPPCCAEAPKGHVLRSRLRCGLSFVWLRHRWLTLVTQEFPRSKRF